MSVQRASAKAKRSPEPFKFRDNLIEPDRLYSPEDLIRILTRSRDGVNSLLSGYESKKASLKTKSLPDGTKAVLGKELIAYLQRREKRGNLREREQVFIQHEDHPSRSNYSELANSIDPQKLFSFAEVDRLFGFVPGFIYKLVIPRYDKPARFESVVCEDGKRKISGRTIIAIAERMAELPLEKVSDKEMMDTLLLEEVSSLYKKFYRQDGKTWLKYNCKRSHKDVYYPVYYDFSSTPWFDKKHLEEISQDMSDKGVIPVQAVCDLTHLKRISITSMIERDESGQPFVLISTLFQKFKLNVVYPYSGQIYFNEREYQNLKQVLEYEAKTYVTAPALVSEMVFNGEQILETVFRQFVSDHSRFEGDKQYCEFSIGKQEFSIPVLRAKYTRSSPIVFFRADAEKLKRYFEASKSNIELQSIRKAIVPFLERIGSEYYQKLLDLISVDSEGKHFLSLGEYGKIDISLSSGSFEAYRATEEDAELIRFYFYMKFSLGKQVRRVFKGFETDLAGKLIRNMESDENLKKKLRLIQHVVSGLDPETVSYISSASNALRFIDSRDIPADLCNKSEFRGMSTLFLANNFIPLPYVSAGDYLLLSKDDGLIYNLFLQGLDHRNEREFYERFLKFSEWVDSHNPKHFGRSHAFAFAIFRYYQISGMEILGHNPQIDQEWQFAPLIDAHLKQLDFGKNALKLERLANLFLTYVED